MTQYLDLPPNRCIAYAQTEGRGPTIVYLGGYKSDMTGNKALALEAWAKVEGRAFLRLDYTGHGQSSGLFEDGCVGDWAADAADTIIARVQGPMVLVGSSMGGWISLIMARAMTERVAGLVGIAAAPDFTDRIWEGMTDAQRAMMVADGRIHAPSDYGDPYVYTHRLIEDGRAQRIFDRPLPLPFLTRWLQGTADTAVPVSDAQRLLDHATGPDIRLTLVKDADHRFSSDLCLTLIVDTLRDVLARAER